jgi:glucokinase
VNVGVDLGGTGTRIVVLSPGGSVVRQLTTATATGVPPEKAVDALLEAIIQVAAGLQITGVGIGASGPVDAEGVIRNPATLGSYSDIPITGLITERLAVPCIIDNDAVTAAIGERTHGAGQDAANLLMVTLGTGVGVAVLRGTTPYRAADGSHPEAGHITVAGPHAPCYCGLLTCWEQLASRTALDALTGDDPARAAARARGGDPLVRALFALYGERVGHGLATLITLFRPDCLVLGGGAAQFLDLLELGISRSLERTSGYDWSVPMVPARLGSLAGAIGAAVMASP